MSKLLKKDTGILLFKLRKGDIILEGNFWPTDTSLTRWCIIKRTLAWGVKYYKYSWTTYDASDLIKIDITRDYAHKLIDNLIEDLTNEPTE